VIRTRFLSRVRRRNDKTRYLAFSYFFVIPTPNGGGICYTSAADKRNDWLRIRGSEPIYEMYSRMYSSRELASSRSSPSKITLPSRKIRNVRGTSTRPPGGTGCM